MKNQRILATVFVLVFMVAFQAMANVKGGGGKSADAKFAYSFRPVQHTDKFVLSFDNLLREKVSIKIYNAANKLVFQEVQYNSGELRKKYDLSSLKDGFYTMKIESEKFSFTEEFEIGKDWNTSSFEATIAPDALNGNKLRVGFANAKSDVTVEITDVAGNIIHSETFSNQFGNQLFNMNDLRPGQYTVTVYSDGNSFTDTYIVE